MLLECKSLNTVKSSNNNSIVLVFHCSLLHVFLHFTDDADLYRYDEL